MGSRLSMEACHTAMNHTRADYMQVPPQIKAAMERRQEDLREDGDGEKRGTTVRCLAMSSHLLLLLTDQLIMRVYPMSLPLITLSQEGCHFL